MVQRVTHFKKLLKLKPEKRKRYFQSFLKILYRIFGGEVMREEMPLCQYDFISMFPHSLQYKFLPTILPQKSPNSFTLLRIIEYTCDIAYKALVMGPWWLVHTYFSMHCYCHFNFWMYFAFSHFQPFKFSGSVLPASAAWWFIHTFQRWAFTQSVCALWVYFVCEILSLSFLLLCTHKWNSNEKLLIWNCHSNVLLYCRYSLKFTVVVHLMMYIPQYRK